jgi:hypothetical protein
MKKIIYKLIAVVTLLFASVAQADEIVVIANSASPVSSISVSDLKKIYLKKKKYFTEGGRVIPADQSVDSPVRKDFYEAIIGMSATELQHYWSKQIFTGKGTPPRVMKSDAKMLEWVSDSVKAIGYVNKSAIDDSSKIKVLTLR